MKHKIYRILCTALCCAPLLATAQTSEKTTSPQRLYEEGQNLFRQKAFAAAMSPLQAFIKQTGAEGNPLPTAGEKEEAEYMLVCAEYELRSPNSIELLREYLDTYPDTPHANRFMPLSLPPISSKENMMMRWQCSIPPGSTFWAMKNGMT